MSFCQHFKYGKPLGVGVGVGIGIGFLDPNSDTDSDLNLREPPETRATCCYPDVPVAQARAPNLRVRDR
jgi:hypothetical protein